ncbi:sugar O-acetyltransferase [Companilactobacillus kimchii]|uniref:Acetyltransferase n=2 Tax=Companilactobacillus kimchii TaxID=2801452 RepID=A0ABR5NT23_9LACO|nr:sugar O-acetyltransferase [Companilactobacillus kimchii]KAE9562109.1 hypothetical protein ATN91_05840 [Companilactobacillus kimchii]KRK51275.1 maltose O-acetyltransferase [Companilactobacillus kimchii DSM 13961 = JCM 10707]OWF34243.1 Maltose O-acetyltransferase [Companilactobacillus kimchii]GEO46156.1 maltose acetyltransferase [Companilactobacillus paralimentarius]
MNEFEKSQKGLPHIFSSEMMDMYLKSAELTDEYNQLPVRNEEKKQKLLEKLLGSVGNDVMIMPAFRCEFGFNIFVGDRVFVNYNCVFSDNGKITIGNDVRIAPNVGLYTVNHAFDSEERAEGLQIYKPIEIKDKVWLGANVVVLPGVTIGEGSIVGAGSVVTKDIPASVIAAGNPCKVIREIRESDKLV